MYDAKPFNLPIRSWTVTVKFPKEFLAKQVYHPLLSKTVSGNFRVLPLVLIMVSEDVSFPLYQVILG